MKKISESFVEELKANNLIGLPFSWGSDGTFEFSETITQEQKQNILSVYAAHNPLDDLSRLREEKIKLIKLESARRIEEVYPAYKQRNMLAAVAKIINRDVVSRKQSLPNPVLSVEELAELSSADQMHTFINAIRAKSDTLEAEVNTLDLDGLLAYDVTDDNKWSIV